MGRYERLCICHDCDLPNRVPALVAGAVAHCARCQARLIGHPRNFLARTTALSLACLVLFALANAFPFIGLGAPGSEVETTLASGVVTLFEARMPLLASLVLVTSLLAPAVQIVCLVYVLPPLLVGRCLPGAGRAMRWLGEIAHWSMMEVFLLGILVSMVKLGGLAEVIPGISLWAFGGLIVLLTWTMSTLEPMLIWDAIDEAKPWSWPG